MFAYKYQNVYLDRKGVWAHKLDPSTVYQTINELLQVVKKTAPAIGPEDSLVRVQQQEAFVEVEVIS